ncbi:YdeI/OmpD-associated family protein [Pedobacter sp. KACC 23697]|uniref:YdeI/OmpD-associated family protein n=1 Tax=Pedobacter sp. KACC 23697 TaxID=3149230 RepID=A0AAU7KBC1_9SPHI
MDIKKPKPFNAKIKIIGINPFVFVPEEVLNYVFHQSGKNKGQLPVKMKIDGHGFKQTLVKYAGDWRLYLNMPMRKAAGKDIGDTATFEIEFDTEERTIRINPKLVQALAENKQARDIFESLAPHLQKEIIRYIANLKTEESVDRNVKKAIQFLLGKERFIGRDGI